MIHCCMHHASLRIRISKVQDFGNFELSPMNIGWVEISFKLTLMMLHQDMLYFEVLSDIYRLFEIKANIGWVEISFKLTLTMLNQDNSYVLKNM